MTYVSSGAKQKIDGGEPQYFRTKKALTEALKTAPETVLLVTFGFNSGLPTLATEMVEGLKYSVNGPDPERVRIWGTTLEKRGGVIFQDQKAVPPK